MTYIKNAGFKEENYVSHITWGTDGEYIIPIKKIRKGETVEIDVKKLRDEQIPDEQGRTIPLNISKGQIHWSLRRSESTVEGALANKIPLVGQATQIDTVKGVSYSYFCLSCCDYEAYSFATLVPSNAQANHPISFQYLILENGRDCYGNIMSGRNITGLGYDWQSTNTSAATVNSSGYATTVGGGQTQIKVKVQLPRYEFYSPSCPGGGGGPYFAAKEKSIETGDKVPLQTKGKKDSREVLFNKIAFKKESKQNAALIPDGCDCLTITDVHNLTANLTVNQVVIKRDGQPITTSNNTTIVGERINLTAEVIPSGTLSNHSWTIPPTAIKDFVVSQDQTQGNTVAVDGLNTSSVNFVWVDGGGANLEDFVAKQVEYRATLNGQQILGQATFNVKRPKVVLKTETQTTNVKAYSNGEEELYFGTPTKAGIKFYNEVSPMFPTSFSGTTAWVQIINNSYREIHPPNSPPVTTTVSGLDGCFPYTAFGSGQAFDSPFQRIAIISQSTGMLVRSVSGNVNDNFTMWLMFKPNSTGASWVPLKKVNWAWVASYQLSASGVYTVSDNSSQNPVFQDTLSFPAWSNLVPSNDPCP